MENTPFVLSEKFCSEDENQRKEHFQEEFGRYIVDSLSAAFSKSYNGFDAFEDRDRMRYVALG